MAQSIDVYFDYISPYAYFGWRNVRALAEQRGFEVVPHPVVFAALLAHHGQLGPAEIPAKRAWTFRHVARHAAIHNIPLEGPAKHPFRSIDALRIGCVVANDRNQHLRVVDALFDAIWAEGIDGGDPEAIAGALTRRGFDGAALVEGTAASEVKSMLKDETTAAIERGVFGVPTFAVSDELFWGNDSLAHLELVLDGRDPLDPTLVDRILTRPSGAVRKRS